MTIWITAALLFALFGGLGYAKGAIRMVFPLIGLVLGVFLAVPLGPVVKSLVPLVGLKNPIWSILLPPVIVFFLIALIFIIAGFIAHWKINLYYKYRTDDYQRLSWERLNRRLGISIGLLAGAAYTLLLGLIVYILGYSTVQISAGENETGAVKYLNQARTDLHATGLDKTVAAFDPTPENYYLAADILGLIYHNRLLESRLSAYPPFLSFAERQEFQDIANDTDYLNLWASQAAMSQFVSNPKTQAILGNQEIVQQLQQTDLKDLLEYLNTGESPKFADLKILGRWQLDPYATLQQEKRHRSRMTTAEMKMLKQELEFKKYLTLVATPDNNVKLKGPDFAALMKKYLGEMKAYTEGATRKPAPTPLPAPAPTQPTTQPGMSPDMARRYGLNPGAPNRTPTPAAPARTPRTLAPGAPGASPAATASGPPTPAAIAAEIAKLPTVVLAQGNWKGDSDKYELSLQAQVSSLPFEDAKKSATLAAEIRDGRLYLTAGDETMVLEKF